ncbi:MAG TPA: sialate O-acetylesterase [Candidatus Methylacidiphilales bacterium]
MQIPALLLTVMLCIGTAATEARAEHYDVFLLAGQSNMDGRGSKKQLVGPLAKWALPRPDILIAYSSSSLHGPVCSSGGWKPLEPGYSAPGGKQRDTVVLPGGSFGPEVSFGATLADGMSGKHIALIKFAEGGTNLKRDWNPTNPGLLHDQFVAFVKASLLALTQRGDTYQIDGLAWHQGEGDADEAPAVYQQQLTDLIRVFRADFSTPDLPVVLGEIFENGKRESIRTAQLAICQAVPQAYFASSGGLTTVDKDTHFNGPSQIELGRRMAKALLSRTNVDPSLPPLPNP